MLPFIVDISEILDTPGVSVEVDGEYPLDELVVGDETYPLIRPARVSAFVANAGAGFVATGSVTAEVTAACSRCLVEFPLSIRGEIEGFWTRTGGEPSDEPAQPVGEDGTIDLGESLYAALVVEAPFAPVHDESCAGLCATCGCDLNVETCECDEPASADHPFAGLAALLEVDEKPSDE